jgi:predicted HicB family RNase H-like nuclease
MPVRYPLNLPIELKREAEEAAKKQGISLNRLSFGPYPKK